MTGKNRNHGPALERISEVLEAALEHGQSQAARSSESRGRPGEISAIARILDIPVSTAHRQVAALVEAGWLQTVGRGRHIPGARLRRLARLMDIQQILVSAAADPLARLAARTGSVAQLGSLDDQMVTYRLKTGQGAAQLFTRVGMQLEAYCSGIGKVLLAHLPAEEREAYLAGGPFPRLTERTITEPHALRVELARVHDLGFAIDDGEIDDHLRCFAMPLRDGEGRVVAAISLSTTVIDGVPSASSDAEMLALVRAAIDEIQAAAFQ